MLKASLYSLFGLLLIAVATPAQAVESLPFEAADLWTTGCGDPPVSAETTAVSSLDATCTVTCGSHPSVSCTTSGTCTAVDQNCQAGDQGYVECDGERTYCAPCCQDGSIRYVDTGGCCKPTLAQQSYQRCVDGVWVHQYYTCYVVPFCPYL